MFDRPGRVRGFFRSVSENEFRNESVTGGTCAGVMRRFKLSEPVSGVRVNFAACRDGKCACRNIACLPCGSRRLLVNALFGGCVGVVRGGRAAGAGGGCVLSDVLSDVRSR